MTPQGAWCIRSGVTNEEIAVSIRCRSGGYNAGYRDYAGQVDAKRIYGD
jgi:hypothetical protein